MLRHLAQDEGKNWHPSLHTWPIQWNNKIQASFYWCHEVSWAWGFNFIMFGQGSSCMLCWSGRHFVTCKWYVCVLLKPSSLPQLAAGWRREAEASTAVTLCSRRFDLLPSLVSLVDLVKECECAYFFFSCQDREHVNCDVFVNKNASKITLMASISKHGSEFLFVFDRLHYNLLVILSLVKLQF